MKFSQSKKKCIRVMDLKSSIVLTIVCGCWLSSAWAHQHDRPATLRHDNFQLLANYSSNSNSHNNNSNSNHDHNNNYNNDAQQESSLHEAASKLQLLRRISQNLDRHHQSVSKRDLINAQQSITNTDQLTGSNLQPDLNGQNSDINNSNSNRLISAILIQNLLSNQQQPGDNFNNHRISERYVNITSQSASDAQSVAMRVNQQQQQANEYLQQQQQQQQQQLNVAKANSRDDADSKVIRQQQQQQQRILSNRWINFERSFEQSLDSIASYIMPLISQTIANSSGSSSVTMSCKQNLIDLMRDSRDERAVLAQLLDASAKLPSGILEGTLTELGNYGECLRITTSGKQSLNIRGAYCTIQIKPPLPARPRLHTICQKQLIASTTIGNVSSTTNKIVRHLAQHSHEFHYVGLRMGLCVPSKCTKLDIQTLLSGYLGQHELSVDVKSCQTMASRPNTYDNYQLSIMSTFAFITLLVILGTLYEIYSNDTGHNRLPPVYHESDQHSMVPPTKKRSHTAASDNFALASDRRKESPSMLLYNDFIDPTIKQQQRQQIGEVMEQNQWQYDENCRGKQHRKQTGLLGSILLCFSLIRNCQQLVRVKHHYNKTIKVIAPSESSSNTSIDAIPAPADDLQVIHGLRVVTMTWIIFSHSIGLVNPEMMSNLFALSQLSCTSLPLQALLNGTLAVNTFFMISGLVTAISFARKCLQPSGVGGSSSTSTSSNNDNNNNLLLLRQQLVAATATNKQVVVDVNSAAAAACNSESETTDAKLINDNNDLSSSSSLSGASSRRSSNGKEATSGACSKQIVADNRSDYRRHIGSLSESVSDSEAGPCRSSSGDAAIGGSAADSTASQQQTNEPLEFQPLLWIVMRYVRLTPTYAAIIGVSVVLPLTGSGPFWQETIDSLSDNCRHNWWKNLLYVNNFLDTNKLCLIHSWYLSNDFQFHLVALVLIALYLRSHKVALMALASLLVASSLATAYVSIENNFPPTIVTTSPAVMERWTFIHSLYYKPWPHLASYLIGLLTGYCIVATNNGLRRHLTAPQKLLGWLISVSLALAVLNSIYPWNMGIRVDPLVTGLHSATFRTIWSACVAWLVYVSATAAYNNDNNNFDNNPLNRILSWQGFQLASRLTYCAYLVHPLVIYYHFGSLTERLDSSMFAQFHRFMANWIITYVVAFLLALFVETPSLKLQQLLMNFCALKRPLCHDVAANKSPQRHNNSKRWSASNSDIVTCTSTATSNLQTTAGNSTRETSENGSIVDNNCLSSQSNNLDSKSDNLNLVMDHSKPSDIDIHISNHSNTNGNKQAQAKQPIVTCNGKHLPEAIALDTEFQLKLSQAISRGFKIRSQMVGQKLTSSKTTAKAPTPLQVVASGQTNGQEVSSYISDSGLLSKPRRRHHHTTTTKKQQRQNDDDQSMLANDDGQRSEKLLAPLRARKENPSRKNRAMAKLALSSLDNYQHHHHPDNNNVIYDGYEINNAQQQYNLKDANVIKVHLDGGDLNHISMATHSGNTGRNQQHQQLHQDSSESRHLSPASNYQQRQQTLQHNLDGQQFAVNGLGNHQTNWTNLIGLATAQ